MDRHFDDEKIQEKDNRRRKLTANVSAVALVALLLVAGVNAIAGQPVLSVPFGFWRLVGWAALHEIPGAAALGVVTPLILAIVPGVFWVACTTGHAEIPPRPRDGVPYVRRRVERFVAPQLLAMVACAFLAFVGHVYVGAWAAAPFETLAAAAAVIAAGKLGVPVWRAYIMASADTESGGVGNRTTVGQGFRLWGRAAVVIDHPELDGAMAHSSKIELVFGYMSIRLLFHDRHSKQPFYVDVPSLGSPDLVNGLQYELEGAHRNARSRRVNDWPKGFSWPHH